MTEPAPQNCILTGDCLTLMAELPSGSVDLVFADPPFNIGYQYDVYDDNRGREGYLTWSHDWMNQVRRVLKLNGSFWLAIGDEYAAELKVAAQDIGFHCRDWVIWYYTFGVNCTKKFNRSHTHLFHFVQDPDDFTFNADAIKVPSARQTVYNDKRAKSGGRLPDNTWILRPQEVPEWSETDDVWYMSRVAGTFAERQGFHVCQMPERVMERIIRVSSNPGDLVFDPFTGSGTTLAVAKKLERNYLGMELSETYAEGAKRRLDNIAVPGNSPS